MAATGNITEDLEAIRELVVPGTFGYEQYARDGLVPWAPPASESDVEDLRQRMPGFPDELSEVFRVSAAVSAANLLVRDDPNILRVYHRDEHIRDRDVPLYINNPNDDSDTRTYQDDQGWVPDGDLMFVGHFRLATGGPHRGVVYTYEMMGIQRAAWRLSDAIACTRELYESGWYDFHDMSGLKESAEEFQDQVNDLVMPAVTKWHCSPTIAIVAQHIEPPRPPDYDA